MNPRFSPPPITLTEFHLLAQVEQRLYHSGLDFEPSHGAELDAIFAAVNDVGEISAPDHVEFYREDETSVVRRPEGDAAFEATIMLSDLKYSLRGDPFANAAEALRQLAAGLEFAAERVEAAAGK